MRLLSFYLTCLCLGAGFPLMMETALAQGPGILATTTSFQRVYAIVPVIGKGTNDDPLRPMFVPLGGYQQNTVSLVERNNGVKKARTGIISYSSIPSDDGKSALVEFVSIDRAGLREILESKAPGVQVFERGRSGKAEIEAAFKGKRRDFDLSKFQNKVR